jgi:hypothetical protein
MSEQQKEIKKRSKLWKWILVPLLLLLLILAGARWLVQSDMLMDYLRTTAEKEVSSQINGNLSIGSLKGDLLHGIQLADLKITDEDGSDVLVIDSIRVDYTLRNLVRQPYEVDNVIVNGLDGYGEQFGDGVWNFEKLFPPAAEAEAAEETDLPFWKVNYLRIAGSSVSIVSARLPDGKLAVQNLDLEGNIGYSEIGWGVSIDDLRFMLDETRFVQPAEVEASADLLDEQVTLEKLLFNTGRTFMESHANMKSMDQIRGELEFAPLSWLDIKSYVDIPVEQDVSGRIGFEGGLADLTLRLDLEANGLDAFHLEGLLHLDERSSLSEFRVEVRNFDGPVFTGDPLAPAIESLGLAGTGNIVFDEPETGRFDGKLTAAGITLDENSMDDLTMDFSWLESSMDVEIAAGHRGQSVEAIAEIRDLFSDLPSWAASLAGNEINLAVLFDNPELESLVNVTIFAEGRGFELSEEMFTVEASVFDSRWGDQPISQIGFDGGLSANHINGFLNIEIGNSRIGSEVFAEGWQTEPVYSFSARMMEFNLADLTGMEEFPTHLNATFDGHGMWFDPEKLELNANLEFAPSLVNNEPIENLKADLEIRNQTVIVTDAELISQIADASFSLRQHLFDFRDVNNTFDIDARIKDIQPLSPLLGVDSLKAGGEFTGSLYRQVEGDLQFNGSMYLEEIVYDTLFTIEMVEGNILARLPEEPELDIDLDIRTPVVNGFALQTVSLSTRIVLHEEMTAGILSLDFVQDEENAVHHKGRFEYLENDLLFRTDELEFRTPDRTLNLQRPFELTWKENVVRMDTLHIQSPEGTAYLKLAIPYLDENRQELTLDASLLDLGTLQRSVLDEHYVDAFLSGQLEFKRENEDITSNLGLLFSEITYHNGVIDSLKIDMDIREKRLLASIGAWEGQNELLRMNGDLPYEPGDPLTFDEEFFEQPVEGEVILPSTPIAFWKQFLGDEVELDAEGDLAFSSQIRGTAGTPELSGKLDLKRGNLSGVSIDSIAVDFGYSHAESTIRLDGDITSLGAKIAGFEAILPLYLDMQALRVDLPDESDEVYASFVSDDFDLAILNDFLDRDLMRDLRGRLSGNVELHGPIASLEPSGNIRLRGGNLRVIPAGITLGEIASDIRIEPDMVRLESFSMRSGPGRFTASGSVELQDMTPGNIDLVLRANQFRASNTVDINAVVDLNSRLLGTFESPQLTGSLSFRSGFVNLQNFGEQAVEDVQLEDEPETVNIAFYDAMGVEMRVLFDRQFFIRNRQYLDMEIELAGEIDLVKEAGTDLQMFGSIEGVRGYARPLGRNFTLEEAVVTFYGPINNPEMNVRTVHRPPQAAEEISIWYIIEGTVEDPDFRFESEPFLELQDIISYTLFGRPFYALESWQQAISGGSRGTSAADVALDLILDRVEMLAAQQLGIDVVQIDTDRSGSSQSTTIKTGWFLTNRTFFAVLNEISGTSPKTLFMLEYMIRRNLELIVIQGDDSREGIDLRWRYDY